MTAGGSLLVTPVGLHESEENNTGHVSTAAVSSCSSLLCVGLFGSTLSVAVEPVEGFAFPLFHRAEFKKHIRENKFAAQCVMNQNCFFFIVMGNNEI